MLLDRRESSQNPPTMIVSIALGSKDVRGNNFHLTNEFKLWKDLVNTVNVHLFVACQRF